jgi:hypothetical protein
MKRHFALIAAALLVATAGAYAQETPQAPTPQNTQELKDAKYTNDSVGRISFVEGKGFVQRASDLGYEEASLNMPISEGDRIGTSEGRLEVHFGRGNYIRLDENTKADILNLPKKDDDVARIRVWSGNVFLAVGTLSKEKAIELHTADSSFYVLDRGVYRVNVRENHDTEILVYKGLIEAAGGDGSTLLKAGQRLEIAEGRFASKPSTFLIAANDAFDKFNESRASVTGREYAKAKLPEELSDYEGELDENGHWAYLAPYGNVWIPNGVGPDWRPYYDGRWTWLPLSGWTWWPYEPWGWATFHYGRWHWGFDLGWYWIPMTMWGPAWVDWWWDDFYFGWAPLSYWGYPGVLLNGMYYGHYYGNYYPYGSRALTVVRRDHLKDPHIAANALRGDSLKGLTKMSLTSRTLSLRPAGTKITVQPLNGNRVMLRNDRTTGLERAGGRSTVGAAGTTGTTGPRAIRKPDTPTSGTKSQGQGQGAKSGTAAKPQSVRNPDKGSRSSGSGKSTTSGGRNIRKHDGSPATSASSAGGFQSDPSISGTSSRVGSTRTTYGYPSSPSIKAPSSSGSTGSGRTRTYSGSSSRTNSGSSVGRSSSSSSRRSSGSRTRSSSVRSSGSSSRSSSRSGSSRGSSSGGSSSRGSSSRSSGSHGGGGARRK